jgi:hypothetical protein
MPTAAELERLEGIVRRLTPLSDVQRGELIRAGDWNTLVDALLEVARAVLASGDVNQAVRHEHVDEVNVGWLDPRLRALIEKGPLGEPSAQGKLDGIVRDLVRERDRIATLSASVGETRTLASELALREEVRESALTDVRRSVDAIPDARADVLEVRDTLRNLQTEIGRAIEIGEGLVIDGEPFDASRFAERVTNLEGLQERLTAPDGTMLDASALERRLAELTNTFVTRDEVGDIAGGAVTLPDDLRVLLEERLAADLGTRFAGDLDRTAAGLRAEITRQFSEVEGLVGRGIADATPGITESTLGAVRGEIAASEDSIRTSILGTLDERIDESTASVLGTLDERTSALEQELTGDLRERMSVQIREAVAPLETSVAQLRGDLATTSTSVTRVEQQQVANSARIEAVERDSRLSQRNLEASLLAAIDQRIAGQTAIFDQRLAQLETGMRDRVSVAVADASAALRTELAQLAASNARREAQLAVSQLRGELVDLTRSEVSTRVTEASTVLRNEFRIDRPFDPGRGGVIR